MNLIGSAVRHSKVCPLGAASFLQLNVDGMRGLLARGNVNSNSVSRQFVVGCQEQAAQLLLESFVEVEVDKRVVDVRAFGKKSREDKTLRRHVAGLFVEYEEEGHNCVRRPGNHEPKTDAEKHLEEEVTKQILLLQ